jgi:hypothetical protein
MSTTGSERCDSQMANFNYKNCAADKTKWAAFRFLNGNTQGCDKFESKILKI